MHRLCYTIDGSEERRGLPRALKTRFTVGQKLKPLRDPFHCWASLPGCEKGGMWPVLASLGVRKGGNVARSSLPGWVRKEGMWSVLASLDG